MEIANSPQPVRTSLNGLPFFVHQAAVDGGLSGEIVKNGRYEVGEMLTMSRVVRAGDCAVDVGANVGTHTVHLSNLVGPDGTVVAFEPYPPHHSLLQLNAATSGRGNVIAVRLALGNRIGAGTMHVAKDGNLGDNQTYDRGEGRPTVPVRMTTLDAFMGGWGVDIDFIKIDVQGYELHVLEGASGVLRRSPRVAMILEFWPPGLRKAGRDWRDLDPLLDDLGFRHLYAIDEVRMMLANISGPRLKGVMRQGLYDPDGRRHDPEEMGLVNLFCSKIEFPALANR